MQESRLSPTQALREASERARDAEVRKASAMRPVTRKGGRQQTAMRRELEKLKPDIMMLVYQHFTAREIFKILQEYGLSNYTVLRDAITRWRKEAGLPQNFRRYQGTPKPDLGNSQPPQAKSQDLTTNADC